MEGMWGGRGQGEQKSLILYSPSSQNQIMDGWVRCAKLALELTLQLAFRHPKPHIKQFI